MPDEVKENGQQTISDSLQSIGTAALATGAGAAVFYRIGGDKLVSDPLNKINRVWEQRNEILGNGPLQRTSSEWMDVLNKTLETFRNTPARSSEDFLFNPMHNTVIDNIVKAYQLELSPGEIKAKMYASEINTYVTNSSLFRSLSKDIQEEIIDKLPGIIANAEDPSKIASMQDSLTGLLGRNKNVFQDIVQLVQKRRQEIPQDEYIKKSARAQQTIDTMIRELRDPKHLAEVAKSQENWKTKLKGQKLATVRDMLREDNIRLFDENILSIPRESVAIHYTEIAKKYYQSLLNQNKTKEAEQFLDMTISSELFVDDTGKIHSYRTMNRIEQRIMDSVASTVPGRLLHIRDFIIRNMAPTSLFIPSGSLNPTLQHYLDPATGGYRTTKDVVVLNGRYFYEIDRQTGALSLMPESGHLTTANVVLGSTRRAEKAMTGTEQRMATPQGGRLRQLLDYGQNPGTGFNRIDRSQLAEARGDNMQYFRTLERNKRQLLMMDPVTDEEQEIFDAFINREYGRVRNWYRFMQENTYALNSYMIRALQRIVPPEDTFTIQDSVVKALNMNSTEEIVRALGVRGNDFSLDNFRNADLQRLLSLYMRDPKHFETMRFQSKYDPERLAYEVDSKITLTGKDMLRTEVQREYFMQLYSVQTGNGNRFANIVSMLEQLAKDPNITRQQIEEAKRLAMFSIVSLQNSISSTTSVTNARDKVGTIRNLYSTLINKDTEDKQLIQNIYEGMEAQRSSDATRFKGLDPDVIPASNFGADYVVHHKTGLSELASIKSINDATKIKAAFKTFGKELIAGADNPEYLSYISQRLYFLLTLRLNADIGRGNVNAILGIPYSFLPDIGLGFGLSKGKENVWKGFSNLLLKRALPIAAGLTYFDWLNDTQREITGMSTLEATESGLQNIGLGIRSTLDAFGITPWLKNVKEAVPIWQYLDGDGEPFHSAEEHREWLQNGYEPVRRGRYWLFGSANEFRGSSIAYWRPNSLRRETANARDISIYGDYDSKWSHSLLPTPSHPLSPLMAVLDPYYIEREHYYDRPYPVTGPFFQIGTPWGAVLNPTLGELIKPVRDMHQGRLFGGVDIQALLYAMNQETKRRAEAKDRGNLFIIRNGRIEPMDFVAYNAPTDTQRILSAQYENGELIDVAASNGLYQGGVDVADYISENNTKESVAFTAEGQPIQVRGSAPGNLSSIYENELSPTESLQLSLAGSSMFSRTVLDALNYINQSTKEKARVYSQLNDGAFFDASQGIIFPSKFRYERSDIQEQLDNADAVAEAIASRQGMGMVHELAVSARMISGIYGWMAGGLGDFGEMNRPHIATSQDIASYTRAFWDAQIGGLGGDVMEIGRRIIPTYGRYTAINPLMNTMPDWLPERFRFGDPYTKVPEGELRLPGRGYEALYQLHPDMYGSYGALDRYRILSDIAPFSAEAKFWKKVAQKTAQSPEEKAEYNAIRDRANATGTRHEFFDYKFIGRGVDWQTAVVSEVLNRGKFKIVGSDEIYTMAGISVQNVNQQGTDQTLLQYIRPGQEISLGVDENEAYRHVNDSTNSISAAVWVNGESINARMVDEGAARYKKSDTSSAAEIGRYTWGVRTLGTLSELVAHAPIPLFHSQWMRIDSPLESYINDYVYGTPYQTWSDVWGTTIEPGLERAISTPTIMAVGEGTRILNDYVQNNQREVLRQINKVNDALGVKPWKNIEGLRRATNVAFTLGNRGAFMGGIIGSTLKLTGSGAASFVKNARTIGANAALFASLYSSYQYENPLWPIATYARAAYVSANLLNKLIPTNPKAAATIGAIAGLAMWADAPGGGLTSDRSVWIPDRARTRWLMNDYWDRITYIKMMGLYHRAAQEAKEQEGVDIERFIQIQEEDQRAKAELKEELLREKAELERRHGDKDAITLINKKLLALSSTKAVVRGGEWTKSAILYKQAADATMYGLKQNANMTDILRALPAEDRDYFMEFVQERDKKKRHEILQYVSPQLGRALRQMWTGEYEEPISNETFFRKFNLPSSDWVGWRPDINLADVKAKMIKNEGLLFSDYGIYESAYRDPDVINAPYLEWRDETRSPLALQIKLKADLEGMGLTDVNVSVEPKPSTGIQIMSTIYEHMPATVQEMVYNAFAEE